ncbi:MAG: hypothetical protein E6H09_09445 [Bacteroidetes bacterium]|nr:MAG: hypothetical protein E6H09_09445 [Bacteroidota bacterium]
MLRFLLYLLLGWLAFNFIFRFVIPVYRTTRQLKKKFREMHDHMQEERVNQTQQSAQRKSTPQATGKDYIDFEEIK